MHRNYCSILSASIETQFATAPVNSRLLLLEYNYPWGEDVLTENTIPAEVNLFLERAIEQDVFSRILFIKNKQSTRDKITLFTVNNRDDAPFMKRVILNKYTEISDLDLNACFSNDDGNVFKDPVYLVCTHGKVDVCCAKFGIPIFKALTELDANTWEATHVTGDRFAPNVVQLPYSHYYGWLDVNEMDTFYNGIKNGDIFIDKYRGRACHTKGEQAAEFFLRNALNAYRFDDLKLLSSCAFKENISIARFCYGLINEQFDVYYSTKKSAEKYLMNCKANEAVHVDQFKLADIVKL
jgi:hypothetical protein